MYLRGYSDRYLRLRVKSIAHAFIPLRVNLGLELPNRANMLTIVRAAKRGKTPHRASAACSKYQRCFRTNAPFHGTFPVP